MFEARDRIGNQSKIRALIVVDIISEFIRIQMVFDHALGTPPWVGAGEVGFAVAVGVKQGRNLGILELG